MINSWELSILIEISVLLLADYEQELSYISHRIRCVKDFLAIFIALQFANLLTVMIKKK